MHHPEELQSLAGLGPVAVQSNEYGIKFYYNYRPLAGLPVRLNIRYVINAGGTVTNSNALVFRLKTVANFWHAWLAYGDFFNSLSDTFSE